MKTVFFIVLAVIMLGLLSFDYFYKRAFRIDEFQYEGLINNNPETVQTAINFALTRGGLSTNSWTADPVSEWQPANALDRIGKEDVSLRITIRNSTQEFIYLRIELPKAGGNALLKLYRGE